MTAYTIQSYRDEKWICIGSFYEYKRGAYGRSLYSDLPFAFSNFYDDKWLRAVPHIKGISIRLHFMRPDLEDRIFLAEDLKDCERVMKIVEEKTAYLAEDPPGVPEKGVGSYIVRAGWRVRDEYEEDPTADFIIRDEAIAYARSLAAEGIDAFVYDDTLPVFMSRIGTFEAKPSPKP